MSRNVESSANIDRSAPPLLCSADLDTHATAALDRLARWAAKALRAPVALISLVEGREHEIASCTSSSAEWISQGGEPLARLAGNQAARTPNPLVVHDVAQVAPRADVPPGVAAYVTVPLIDAGGTVHGTFFVADQRPRHWTAEDVELMAELAASALTELELRAARAEAERETRWSNDQQAVLELIAAQAPLQQTLSELLRIAEAHAPEMLSSIMLVERIRGRPDRLRSVAAPSLPRTFTSAVDDLPVQEGSGMCATCALRNEVVVVDDIAGDPLTAPFADLCAAHGIHGGWSTPIRSTTGTVLGAFALYYSSSRRPRPGDQRVVDRSIHLAKLAIEQDDSARALRDNAKRAQSLAREQTALQRVATSIAAATPSDEVFALVAEQVARLLKADAGYVLRFEDELRYRNVGAWARGPAAAIETRTILSHEPDDPLARLRGGADAARRFDAGAGADMLGMLHRIAAPVIVDGKPWGVVLALRGGRREFPREDERRIDRFAQLTSVTVANAEAHARLAMLAQTDPLTKLANRRTFDERLKQETERAHRHTRALSVVLVDVDQFKMINDRFGHAAGDNVLVHLADNLRAVMRSGDLLARIGGDELAMILPDCRPQKAALVTRRMLAAVESKPMAQRHGVTLSAGVAGLAAEQTADDLLRCADQALYRAKDGGRNQVVTYELDLPEHSDMRLSA